jgi:hypothetical protein
VPLLVGASLLLVCLVLCPAAHYALFQAAAAARLPVAGDPGDPVMGLVILVQAAAPSAQSVLLLSEMRCNGIVCLRH